MRPSLDGTGGRTSRRYLWSSYVLPLYHISNVGSILLHPASGGAGLKPGMLTISQQEAEHKPTAPRPDVSTHSRPWKPQQSVMIQNKKKKQLYNIQQRLASTLGFIKDI